MNIKKVGLLVAITGVLFSCENNEPELPKGDYDNGILVTNEGAFNGGTGTLNEFTVAYDEGKPIGVLTGHDGCADHTDKFRQHLHQICFL